MVGQLSVEECILEYMHREIGPNDQVGIKE